MSKRILISNAHLKDIGGSELVAVELAEEYAQRGWHVELYSPLIGEPLKSTIHPSVIVTDKFPDLITRWDIIWDHHGTLMPYVEKRKGTILVANHMSSYVDAEKPKYAPGKPDRIFANSPETIESMAPAYRERAELFQNPAPRGWHKNMVSGESAMFISKHRPRELEAIIGTLEIPCVVHNGDRRIHRADFNNARFVVCNGKSVQYAMCAGVPVFVYDSFGGPGWLTEENFELTGYYNFSGRGFSKGAAVLESLFAYATAKPVPDKLVNWRFKLHEWLYYNELV